MIVDFLMGGGTQAGLVFAFCLAALVVVSVGTTLSQYGDALGERTGLDSGLVGLLFLAAVTSLPELVVSITATITASMRAVGLAGAELNSILSGGADLAIGNMIGSNSFNLLIIAFMDLTQGQGAFLHQLKRTHIMSAASGLGMLGILLFGLCIDRGHGILIPYLEVGVVTPFLAIAYILVMILQGRVEQRDEEQTQDADRKIKGDPLLLCMPTYHFYSVLLFCALMIVLSGIWLSLLGDRMAVMFSLEKSFVGTIFLAISTSLPELVVSIAAVRLGAYNMAIGNVLGSNIFNLLIIFIADLGLRDASILHYASDSHLATISMVLLMTSIVIAGLIYRSTRSIAWLGFDVWLIILVYVFGSGAVFCLQ